MMMQTNTSPRRRKVFGRGRLTWLLIGLMPAPLCLATGVMPPDPDPYTQQAQTAHVYADDGALIRSSFDINLDGRYDEVYYYDGDRVERLDKDTDHDAVIDLRVYFDELDDEQARYLAEAREIKGEDRLVPYQWPAWAPHHVPAWQSPASQGQPAPRYEALRDGAWAGDFTIRLQTGAYSDPIGRRRAIMTQAEFRGGRPVRMTTTPDPGGFYGFAETRYEDGRVVSHASGPNENQIAYRETHINADGVRYISRQDYDGDGTLEYEVTHRDTTVGGPNVTFRLLRRGQWVGDFTHHGSMFVDGLLMQTRDPDTGMIIYRYERGDDGAIAYMYQNRDGVGDCEYRQDADGRLERRVDGEWVGDDTRQ